MSGRPGDDKYLLLFGNVVRVDCIATDKADKRGRKNHPERQSGIRLDHEVAPEHARCVPPEFRLHQTENRGLVARMTWSG